MLGKFFSYWRSASTAEEPLALYHAGDVQQAERVASDRLANAASDRGALLTRAFLLADRGRGKDAIAIAQQLLAGNARDAQAWLAIGRAHAVAGRRKPAGEALEAALQRDGGDPVILAEAALLALAEGRQEKAAQHLARARGKAKRLALAHRELAGFLLQRGQVAAGERQLQEALSVDPNDAIAHANLGAVRKDLGRGEEAVQSFERALALQPQLSEAAFNLAMLRIDRKEWGAAAALLRDYVAQHPRDAEAHYWLGNARMGDADAAGAQGAYEAAVRIDSQHARARWGLVMAQLPAVAVNEQQQAQALQSFERELDRLREWCRTQAKADAWQAVGAQQPFYLAYLEENHAAVLRRYGALCVELMSAWAKRMKVPPPAAVRAGEPLRVGIVSAHVHGHSVWHALLRGWVQHLDRQRFELHLFHTGITSDDETRWAAGQVASLQQGLGEWTAWAKAVSDARLDVVIYPEIGMDASTLRLASLRLARVQLAGWGHPLTTGLPTIDGYLGAQAFEPATATEHYSETLHALPRLGCAYRPYGTRPQVVQLADWGVAPGDRVLVAPGVAFKYGPREDALWVEIARRCAPCKLLFFRGKDGHAARLEQRLRAAFAAAQVDFDAHVRFVPRQSQAAFFGLLQRTDVVLDTVGFSGFNTAMQAVECGTPMVAWEGRFMRGRFASGILRALQLEEWIADSHAAYVDRVVRLCEDAALRDRVRQQIVARRGALYDDAASVKALAALLEQLAA
jgi:protein O-GlcNAc transferase